MIVESITLDSGLSMTLYDRTSHYFGGYYHVKVVAQCDITLLPGYFNDDAEFTHAVGMLGASVRFERLLEKMAVPESAIDGVRSHLIGLFHDSARTYLSHPDFAPRFVRSEYGKGIKSSRAARLRV